MGVTQVAGRVVRHLSIAYFEPTLSADGQKTVLVRTAQRGQVIDPEKLAKGELERLEGLGAFLPAGSTQEDAVRERESILDLYRGQRGDQEAMGRAMRRAAASQSLADVGEGIVDVSSPGAQTDPVTDGNVGRLADHIAANKLNIDDTVGLADGDPERAKRVLEAEHLASGGSPRAGVETALQKIIG